MRLHWSRRISVLCLSVFLAALAVLVVAGMASAIHFRGGTFSWEETAPGDVTFTVETFTRPSNVGNFRIDPDYDSASPSFNALDSPSLVATSSHDAWHWMRGTFSHSYSNSSGTYTVALTGNCRFGDMGNIDYMGNDGCPHVLTIGTIDLSTPPVSWSVYEPHYLCEIDEICTIPVAATASSGATVSYSFGQAGTHVEAGFLQPGDIGANSDPIIHANGTVTWDTSGVALGTQERTFYSMVVLAEADGSAVPLEIMIEICGNYEVRMNQPAERFDPFPGPYGAAGPYGAYYELDWWEFTTATEKCFDHYELQRRPVAGAWQTVQDPTTDINGNGDLVDDKETTDPPRPGTLTCAQYEWRVRLHMDALHTRVGNWSNTVTNGVKLAPDQPRVSVEGSSTVTPLLQDSAMAEVRWERPTDNGCPIQEYEIERRYTGNAHPETPDNPLYSSGWTALGKTRATEEEWDDPMVTALLCDSFEYRVRATNDVGASPWSIAEYIHRETVADMRACFPCQTIQDLMMETYNRDRPIHSQYCFWTTLTQNADHSHPGDLALGTRVYDMVVDDEGLVYVVGSGAPGPRANGGGFPLHSYAPFQSHESAFIAVFDASGSRVLYASYLPGETAEEIILVPGQGAGSSDKVIVAGRTTNPGIVLPGAYSSGAGGDDLYVVRFTPFESTTVEGTYYGGDLGEHGGDWGQRIQLAYEPVEGLIALGGLTGSPMLPRPFDPGYPEPYDDSRSSDSWGGNLDSETDDVAFIVVFDESLNKQVAGPTFFDDDLITFGDFGGLGHPVFRCESRSLDYLGGLEFTPYDPMAGGSQLMASVYARQWGVCGTANPYYPADEYRCFDYGFLDTWSCSGPPCPKGAFSGPSGQEVYGCVDDYNICNKYVWSTTNLTIYHGDNCGGEVVGTEIHVLSTSLETDDLWWTLPDAIGMEADMSANGEFYVVGRTFDRGHITTPDAYQTTLNGGSDAFITVFQDPRLGPGVVYSTFLGGNRDDMAVDIHVTANGSMSVAGRTVNATSFPTEEDPGIAVWDDEDQEAFAAVWLPPGPSGTWAPSFSQALQGSMNYAVYRVDDLGGVHLGGEHEDPNQPTKVTEHAWSGWHACPAREFCAHGKAFAAWLGGNELLPPT